MQSLSHFIKEFLARKGAYILLAQIVQKGLNLLTAIIVIRILSKSDYGLVVLAITILSFILPFIGGGIIQSLMRYGARIPSLYGRKILFRYSFKKGLLYSMGLVVLVILFTPLLVFHIPEGKLFVYIISFQLIGLFLFESVGWYLRVIQRNKAFAFLQIQQGMALFIGNVLSAWFFGAIGLAISTVLIPAIVALIWLRRIHFLKTPDRYNIETPKKEFFRYGFYTSLGGIASQLLFTVDIMVISYLLADAESIAYYKASSMIPFALLFIPSGVILTDFVTLVKESKNKAFLKSYYLRFAAIFLSFSSIIFFGSYLFSNEIMGLFGADYKGENLLLPIFALGIVGGMSIRIPLGNILSAIGWARLNSIFAVIILCMNVILNYFMVLRYGITGAAIATCALMWLSGIFSLIAFAVYLKKL